MRTPHTATHKGTRVRVILLDGTEFIDKFKDRKNRFVYFEKHERVIKGQIKSFTIVKGNPEK